MTSVVDRPVNNSTRNRGVRNKMYRWFGTPTENRAKKYGYLLTVTS